MKCRHSLIFVSHLLFFATGFAHAANLVAVNDNHGITANKFLQVEAPGVLIAGFDYSESVSSAFFFGNNLAPVPLPAAAWLFATGLIVLVGTA